MGAHSFVINHLVMFHNKKLHTLVGYIVCISIKTIEVLFGLDGKLVRYISCLRMEECIFLFIFGVGWITIYLLLFVIVTLFMGYFATFFYFKELTNNWMINMTVQFWEIQHFQFSANLSGIIFWLVLVARVQLFGINLNVCLDGIFNENIKKI